MTANSPVKRAFISYVREDSVIIDGLGEILKAANILYWRDRDSLGPGEMWKTKIREAIKTDTLVFVVCFSSNSVSKKKSYQNEELALAIEEFRLRAPGRTYLIPVRLDDCTIPDWELGAGRTLADINYVDLFGDNHTKNAVSLVETIKRAMGLDAADAATVRTVVEEATTEARPALLRRMSKEMILEESRRIDLDDLVGGEVARILGAMRDSDQFPQSFPQGTSRDQAAVRLAEISEKYWTLIEPFCWSLQVAARWGTPDTLGPWIRGLNAITAEAKKMQPGLQSLAHLRCVPVLSALLTAAIASTHYERWDNFRAILVDNTVAEQNYRVANNRVAIIEGVSPYTSFSDADVVANMLAATIKKDIDFETALAELNSGKSRGFYTPAMNWMFAKLRPVFNEQFHDDAAYEDGFNRAEVALGIVNEDLCEARHAAHGGPFRPYNSWFGRSTWVYHSDHGDPVGEFEHEQASRGLAWSPLQAGLFGGTETRAATAISQYREAFNEIAMKRW